MIAAPPNPDTAKVNGAYYTPRDIARFLVKWAIRSKDDLVLDPSHGGGVFLRAACEYIEQLQGNPGRSIFGIELDASTHAATSGALATIGLPPENLLQADFFLSTRQRLEHFDAVVGNPPFIRYQSFNGAARRQAAAVMHSQGVRLSELASSWAPFVVCSAALLRPGGRLAMVVPMELCHAAYARPVLEFLSRTFRTVHFLSFAERLFPQLSQETLLLLADDRGTHHAKFCWRHMRNVAELDRLGSLPRLCRARRVDTDAIATGRQRLIEEFLPGRARSLYAELRGHEAVRPLGAVADVGIGYVTGANDFFHLSTAAAQHWNIPSSCLEPAVCRGRAFGGLRFTLADWHVAQGEGDAAYLLRLPRAGAAPAPARRYIRHGEATKVNQAYKCRVRQPWYHVPHVYCPDALLTYMSGIAPRLVVNAARVVAPNTLHLVRMLPLPRVPPDAIAVAWRSSLTELSAEIEGHALGGGMLKLEPTEAGRVLLPLPAAEKWQEHVEVLDVLDRHAGPGTVRAAVDQLILRSRLGLTDQDCRCLRTAAAVLRARRLCGSR